MREDGHPGGGALPTVHERARLPRAFALGAPLIALAVGVTTLLASLHLGSAASSPTVQLAAHTPRESPVARVRVVTPLAPPAFVADAAQLVAPGAPLTVLETLARLFDVSGLFSVYNSTAYAVVAPSGAVVSYDTSTGIGQWSYRSAGSSGPPFAAVRALLAHWGLSVPAPRATSASLPVTVTGEPTTLVVTVRTRGGRVLAAAGPAFVVPTHRPVPLVGPSAVARGLDATARAGAPTVVVRSVQLTWSPYLLSDATTWLLPAYRFTGGGPSGPQSVITLAVSADTARIP